MTPDLSHADLARIRVDLLALEGPRHPRQSPQALARAAEYVLSQLAAAGLAVERRPFRFRGAEYANVVGSLPGRDGESARVLVGAHYDTVAGTPGADDNASGVAALLEAARLLTADRPRATLEFVGFALEEPQGLTYAVGSRAFARDARRRGVRYAAALVLEMVGYTDTRSGSQAVPPLLFWKRVPRTGTFLAATGDGQSARLLRAFARAAREAVPELPLVTFRSPCRGWLVPATRLSDNCSFWDAGYPALMLTDTAFLRNPHYHMDTDRVETLDLEFLGRVTDAVVAAVRSLAG